MSLFSGHHCQVCKKDAALRCPKCAELKLPDAYFCSQTCFKSIWAKHKIIHQETIATIKNYLANPTDSLFLGYSFSGKLRPGKISPRRAVPNSIMKPDYAETGDPKSESEARGSGVIKMNNEKDIQGMRIVGKLAREVLDTATAAVRPGITTDELDRIVHEATIERNSYPSPLNYRGFLKSVCTSVNECICHGIPDSRELVEGDIVNIDVTIYHNGYHGDLNETIPVGKIDENSKRLIQAAYEAMFEGINIVRPNTHFYEIGNAIEKFTNTKGFSVCHEYTGHGISDLFHSSPTVYHYANSSFKGRMKAGHIFTIEPMINAKTRHCVLWPDGWTVCTDDGERSAQFENTLLCTEKGVEILTPRTNKSYKFWWMD